MSTAPLHQLLERAANLLRTELRNEASRHDLKLAQLEALHYFGLCNRYSDTPAALTEYLGATKGTVSQTLLALERKGYVKKVTDCDDKRVQRCSLTPQGKALFDLTFPSPVTQLCTKSQRRETATALESWLRNVQIARGNQSFGICHSCAHYKRRTAGGVCGLTQEALTDTDASKICREHFPVIA